MAEFASKGVAGAGLGLGVAGTALGLLNSNGLGGLFNTNGTNGTCSEDHWVNRYELNMQNELTNRDMEIEYLRGQNETNTKIVELSNSVQGKFNEIDKELRDIAVYQATNTVGISCLSNQVTALSNAFTGMTKTVIPNANVCPGWGDVKVCVQPCDSISTTSK